MLSRIISLHSRTHLRLLSRTLSPPSSSSPPLFSQIPKSQFFPNHHHFSTNNNNNDGNGEKPTSDIWNIGQENDNLDEIFGTHVEEMSNGGGNEGRGERKVGNFAGEAPWAMGESRGGGRGGGLFEDLSSGGGNEGRGSRKAAGFTGEAPWAMGESGGGGGRDGGVFKEFEGLSSGGGNEGRGSRNAGGFEALWAMGESGGGGGGGVFDEVEMGGSGDRREPRRERGGEGEFQQWRIGEEEEGGGEDVLGIGGEVGVSGSGDLVEDERSREEREMIAAAEKLQLEKEEQVLLDVVKGPDRAFGDLVAASGITDAMLDSLIALKNFQDIDGLPPLAQIEDERYAKTTRKSSRYEMELQKQEDIANARVRKVDEKGRAYGTGKRKCSIARVWIEPGEGKFAINDKAFDVYFPMLDHRAALLRPFSETKTLGLWDIKCTVKGGGTTGQVDAIRLGISRALQNWEPGLRAPLRDAGFLTRDPRIVERKKPGKAKARKSFQWVKR